LSEKTFKDECKSKFIQFLKNYDHIRLSFHSEHIKAVRKKDPEYFNKVQNTDNLQVTWVENVVDITGLKHDVNELVISILQELDKIAPR